LTPVHPWHREVGQDQIERFGAGLNELQRGFTVRRLFDVKPLAFEAATEKLAEGLFVVDHEYRSSAPDGTVGSGEGRVHRVRAGVGVRL
jgi:hypothetical protein